MSEHFLGAYTIKMERKGSVFVYDVLKNKAIVASGFDMSSSSEEAAVEGIAQRFGIAEVFNQSFEGELCQRH